MPAEVRSQLGLQPGTVVVFELREDGALLRKGSAGQHPVDRLYGTIKIPGTVDAVLDKMRGPRPKRR